MTATEYHLGLLKAKLAKYRAQLLEPTGKSGPKVSALLNLVVRKLHVNVEESFTIWKNFHHHILQIILIMLRFHVNDNYVIGNDQTLNLDPLPSCFREKVSM